MHGITLLVLLLIWGQDSVQSVRFVELSAPAQAAVGKEAIFGCQYEMEDDLLYSVKWYKDGREIFRFMPRNPSSLTLMQFPTTGVNVDLSRSSPDVMTLTNLQRESAGVYKCEVTGEAPVFANGADEKYVDIYDLPKTYPRIKGLKYNYEIGDRVVANCTSSGSKPTATVRWLVNNETVHRVFLRGPWHRVAQEPPDTTETILGLNFMVIPKHYKSGVMEIKCQATIPPLYQREEKQWFTLQPSRPEPEPELYPVEEFPNEPSPRPPDSRSIEGDEISGEIEDDLSDQIPNDAIRNIFNKLHSSINFEHSAISLPTITEAPQNTTDFATLTEKSLGVMVLTILIQVIILL